MCTNTYSNRERFDKVIAETKWCSFFAPQCRVTVLQRLLGVRVVEWLSLDCVARGPGFESRCRRKVLGSDEIICEYLPL